MTKELKTSDFKKIDRIPIGMGAGRLVYEELLAFILNKIIDEGLEIDAPIKLKHDHPDMTNNGLLLHHLDGTYSLTWKSAELLHAYCKTI